MAHISEYEVENLFIDRLESIGYEFVELCDYDDVVANFRRQLAAFNAEKLTEMKGEASFSDAEFGRVMIHVDNHSVYESAKILRDKYVLQLDNGKSVYLDFFGSDVDRNIYQVTHQVTMDKHIEKIVDAYTNRVDIEKFAHVADMAEIEANDWDLNLPRYVDTYEEEEPADLEAVRNDIKRIEGEKKTAVDKAESILRQLGL